MVNTKDVPKKIIEGMRFSSKCDGIFFYFGCTDTFGLLWELSRKGNSSCERKSSRFPSTQKSVSKVFLKDVGTSFHPVFILLTLRNLLNQFGTAHAYKAFLAMYFLLQEIYSIQLFNELGANCPGAFTNLLGLYIMNLQ